MRPVAAEAIAAAEPFQMGRLGERWRRRDRLANRIL
jgi:hypothetical protein